MQPRSFRKLTSVQIRSAALAFSVLTCTSTAMSQREPPRAASDGGAGPSPASATKSARIEVTVDGFRNDRGHALLALFREGRHFPSAPERAARRFEAPVQNGRASFVIEAMPAGEFALSVLHDEDDDKKLKTNWVGIPKEGLGFSRNPRVRFGPPSFEDAKMKIEGGAGLSATIHMKYY
jgi:uncharacterized protein (DUF2141 family)